MIALTMNAQRCAVLEFKAGVGISQADVDGISAIFITYFHPAGYTMVERTQIDKAIDEQGFQRSEMTESQMVRIGQILNVSKIVIGDVNVVMGQYNVDARVINVESGSIAAAEGATFTGSSYRATMQSLAQKLASKIAITSGDKSSTNSVQRTEPYEVYEYLKVFPTDLGIFDAVPLKIIKSINQNQSYGYGTWRLPTNEEIYLMRINNIIGNDNYMTRESKNGIVRLVTDREKGETLPTVPAGYVDLDLPSGTLWKENNEAGGYFTYDQAISRFGNNLPTKEQFKELETSCTWTWIGDGYKVEGPNGECITFPAEGYRHFEGGVYNVGEGGYYWASTLERSSSAWELIFDANGVVITIDPIRLGRSVRLVR